MKSFLAFLCALFCVAQLSAQTKTITGKVVDEKGDGVPSALITVKGAKTNTLTTGEGHFSVTVSASARTIIVSSVGFETQEVEIGAAANLIVKLAITNKQLDEVVVTGYSTVSKTKSALGSSVVGAKDIADVPMSNVNDILQGKAPGLTIMSTTGQPGGSSNIRIRGVGSISAGASPIYVIDGVVIERGQVTNGGAGGSTAFVENNDILSNLNPNDVESVNVLKDAAATSLYGARGGNGVIVITTRRGKAGATKINASAQYGRTMPSLGNWKMMGGKQAFEYEKAILKLNGTSQQDIDNMYPDTLLNRTFNWVDAAFVNANVHNYNLSMSGGNEKTKHFISAGYYDQQGTSLNSDFKRFSLNMSLDNQVSRYFKTGLSLNTSYSNTLGADGAGYYSSAIYGSLVNSPFWLYPYKPDGTLYNGREPEFAKGSGNNPTGDNFLYSAKYNYNRAKQFRGIGKVYGELNLMKWLNVKQTVALDMIYAREKNFFDPTTGNGQNGSDEQNGGIYEGLNNPFTLTSQTSVFGNVDLNNAKHDLSYTLLMEYQKYSNANFTASGTGIVDGRLQVLNITGTPVLAGGGINEYAFLSYLGQANYTYDSRYSLSASLRRDGSSRFGSSNRFATFWSVGGAWHISNEAFMRNVELFSDVRLRASYGTSGVADFANYVAQQLYQYGQTYNGNPGSFPSTPGNPFLTWEKNKQLDIGLEVGILKNRIRTTLEWYNRRGTNLLQNVPVSRTSGYTSIQDNVGTVENKGYEITISSVNITNKNFQWTTDFNMSHNENKVLKLYKGQAIASGSLARIQEGQSLSSWFLPAWAGVDPANGDPLWYLADGKTTTNSYAIASRTENRIFAGNSLPKFTFGLNNSLTYKGINLSFFLYAITGSKIYNQNMYVMGDNDGRGFGKAYYIDADKDYWTTPGQQASRPKPVIGGNKNSSSASTRWIESNDYIRLRNITLGYSLPKSIISRASFSNVRVFITGTNLITITKYRGLDPETSLGGNDVAKYPVNKTITFGVDISL